MPRMHNQLEPPFITPLAVVSSTGKLLVHYGWADECCSNMNSFIFFVCLFPVFIIFHFSTFSFYLRWVPHKSYQGRNHIWKVIVQVCSAYVKYTLLCMADLTFEYIYIDIKARSCNLFNILAQFRPCMIIFFIYWGYEIAELMKNYEWINFKILTVLFTTNFTSQNSLVVMCKV